MEEAYLKLLSPTGPLTLSDFSTAAQALRVLLPSLDIPREWLASSLSKQRSSICGRVFKKGDVVYRCRTCGLDDTCVMCVDCFSAEAHAGHDIQFSVGTSGGGCCDCGDPEAWKRDICCPFHQKISSKDNVEPIPKEILDLVRDRVALLFDFILDVLDYSPSVIDLPATSELLTALSPPENQNEAQAQANGTFEYALILWNDESHSYGEVMDILEETINCPKEAAKKMTENIDLYVSWLIGFIQLGSRSHYDFR
jgi:E3 ubiquitin-protein ligase UBR1